MKTWPELTHDERVRRRNTRGVKSFDKLFTLLTAPMTIPWVFVIDVRQSGWKAAIVNAGANVRDVLLWVTLGRGYLEELWQDVDS